MSRLEGIVTPMITPLKRDYSLDIAGVENLVEYLIKGGVSALFPLGTTGGGPMLPTEMQQEVCSAVCRFSNGRLPVLIGISAAAPADYVKMACYAADHGANGVVAAPPCYIPLDDAECVAFYRDLAKASPLPVYVYNMPGMTKINMPPKVICQLAEIPNIVGYKDSAGDMNAFHEVIFKLKDRKDFSLFMGPDTMMADSVLFGAVGGVNSGSNLYPEVYVNCYKCISSGDVEGARRHQDNINRIQKLYYFRRYIGLSVASSMKTGLKFRGICDNVMLPPIAPVTAETEAKVRAIMEEIDANL